MAVRQWRNHVNLGILALSATLTLAGCKLQTSIKDLKNPEGLPILTMNNASIIEGQTGAMVLSIDKAATSEVTITYYFTDGTALLGSDYTGSMGILTIPVGATQAMVPLNSPDDTIYEGDEQFYVNLIAPANAMAANGVLSKAVTVVDNEVRPKVFITDASATEGGGLTFNVSLDHQSVEAVQFDWSTFVGTATSGVDYTAGTGHISIAPLGLTTTISVASIQDTLYEPTETFEVRASNLVHASVGRITATGTILDDDSAPQISVYDATVVEGGTALFAVSLSAVSGQPVIFSWQTFTGTAGAGDFTSVALTTVTIAAGTTSTTLPVITTQDVLTEANENFTVSLSSVTGASVLDGLATGTIVDDDGLPLLVVWPAPTVTEGAVSNVVVSLSAASGLDVTFNYTTLDDTAVSTQDYTSKSGVATILAGNLSVVIPVTTIDDTHDEATTEYYRLSISSAVNANILTSSALSGINDNDSPPVLYVTDATTSEGGTLMFWATLSAVSDLNVDFNYSTQDGTALQPGDYTQVSNSAKQIVAGSLSVALPVVTTQDSIYEATENMSITLTALSNATAGDTYGVGTITDDDSAPSLYISDATITEGATATLWATLSAISTLPVTFNYATQDGTATQPADYTSATGTLTIPAGSLSVALTVASVQDSLYEGTENLSVTLTALSNATAGDTLGVITINDDDSTPSLYISDAAAVTEGQTAIFTVSLNTVSAQDVTFNFSTVDGTAVSTQDYTARTGVGTILAGSLTYMLTVVTIDDTRDETSPENFTVSLTSSTNSTISDGSGLGLINDNDSPPNLYVTDASTTEGGTLTFWATISAISDLAVTFNYATQDGTAVQPADYTSATGTLTIPAGSLSISFNVVTVQDTLYENNETLSVTLTALANATASDTYGVGTIVNDDTAPQIAVYDATVVEGGTAQFAVSLSAISALDVVFSWQTFTGTAGAGDFTSVALTTVTITAGSTSTNLPVITTQDALSESNETFLVSLSSPTGATFSDALATGTIVDDDGLPLLVVWPAPTVTEGQTSNVVVSLSAASGLDVTFNYTTLDDTAVSTQDYTSKSGVATILAGNLSVVIPVTTIDDTHDEATTEYYRLSISSAVNATILTASDLSGINDNDSPPVLYVTDATTSEGGTLMFWATLSAVSDLNVDFNYSTQDGTALQPGDYTQVSNSAKQIVAGSLSVALPVVTTQDSIYEATENMSITLTALSNATAGDTYGVGTITDDDSAPSLYITDATITEGATATLWATLSAISGQAVTFNYATQDGTATQPADYTSATGTLTIPAGSLSVAISVASVQDSLYEGTENLSVTLTALANATAGDTLGVVTITDDETQPNLVIYDASVTEGGTLRFTVSLSGAAGSNVTFNYQSFDGTATTANSDYTAVSGVGTIPAGSLTYVISVVTTQDAVPESDETLTVSLASVTVATLLDDTGVGTIMNDDSTMTITITDVYSGHGNWNDYIKANNGGTNQFDQPNTACAGTESFYFGCIHGGEKKKATLTGVTSCSNITASDSLGVFNWLCDATSGTAIIYMGGLKDGKGLRDLINPTGPAWRNNQLTVLNGASTLAQSASGVWWLNSIVDLPDNSGSAVVNLSTNPTPAYGPIYTYSSNRSTNGYYLALPKSAVVGLNNAVLRYAGSSSNNCQEWGAVLASPDTTCLIFSDQNFQWIEGNIRGDSSPTSADIGLNFKGSQVRVRNSAVTSYGTGYRASGTNHFLDSSRISNVTYKGFDNYWSDHFLIYNTIFSNAQYGLSSLWGPNIFTKITISGSSYTSFEFGGTQSTYSHFTSLNGSNLYNIFSWDGDNNTYIQMVGCNTNGGNDLLLAGGSDNNTVQYSALCGFGDSSTGNVYTTVFRNGVSMASSFVGMSHVNDTANTSDSYGQASYSSIDWLNYDSPYRLWGKSSSSAFPAADQRGTCTSGTCQMWDLRLRTTDTQLFNKSGDGTTTNQAFVNNSTCPSAVNGNKSVTDSSGRTFLANAIEVMGDGVGNDNTLCESGEACIYSPNFGAYQGEGDYTTLKCNFQNGTVTNVTMYAYPTNGVTVPPDLYLTDASVTEGGTLSFVASLTATLSSAVTFNYQT